MYSVNIEIQGTHMERLMEREAKWRFSVSFELAPLLWKHEPQDGLVRLQEPCFNRRKNSPFAELKLLFVGHQRSFKFIYKKGKIKQEILAPTITVPATPVLRQFCVKNTLCTGTTCAQNGTTLVEGKLPSNEHFLWSQSRNAAI